MTHAPYSAWRASLAKFPGQKADDMRKQQDAAHHRHRRGVAIVVDSSADIPDEELERLEIHMVPMRVHFGERSYLDKVSMRPGEFYRELADNPQHPKTSQPPPGDFRRIFEFLASHYETVVSINVTARVSGTLAAAQAPRSVCGTRQGDRDRQQERFARTGLACHAGRVCAGGHERAAGERSRAGQWYRAF